jgi:hypothetical protein
MNSLSPLGAVLAQTYVVGGSPCSGKSTLAERLCAERGWTYYQIDAREADHMARCVPDRHPTMHAFTRMNWEQIWMRSVELQVREEFEYYRERFELVLEDLAKVGPGRPVLVEGAGILPEFLPRHGFDLRKAVFLAPTQEFQLRYYAQRGFIHTILKDCSDPQAAFANWMERDQRFGTEVLSAARALGCRTLVVDGSLGIEAQYQKIKAWLDS